MPRVSHRIDLTSASSRLGGFKYLFPCPGKGSGTSCGFFKDPRPELLMLDGQQRLTSLLYALNAPRLTLKDSYQRRWFFIDLATLLTEPDNDEIVFDRSERELDGLDELEIQYSRRVLPCTSRGVRGGGLRLASDYNSSSGLRFDRQARATMALEKRLGASDYLIRYHIDQRRHVGVRARPQLDNR